MPMRKILNVINYFISAMRNCLNAFKPLSPFPFSPSFSLSLSLSDIHTHTQTDSFFFLLKSGSEAWSSMHCKFMHLNFSSEGQYPLCPLWTSEKSLRKINLATMLSFHPCLLLVFFPLSSIKLNYLLNFCLV